MNRSELPGGFSEEDAGTWKMLMRDFVARLHGSGCAQAIEGFEALGLSSEIEDMWEVDQRLYALSGWRMFPVEGLISSQEFYSLLRARMFPIAPRMRSRAELEFSESPDLFHDVVGHLPMFTNPSYGEFLLTVARTSERHTGSAAAQEALDRFYWFTAETGLVIERGETKVIGAAALTSGAEVRNALNNSISRLPLKPSTVFDTPYDIFTVQKEYFVADSYQDLLATAGRLDDALAAVVGTEI